MDEITSAFLAAHERLLAGKPRNKKLKERAAAGQLKVNISTVALEAKRARGLIALQNCRYPEVRARILGERSEPGPVNTAADAMNALRATIAELRLERDNALTEAARHFHARRRAERHAKKWEQVYKRLRDERLQSRGEKVVHLIPPED